MELDEVIGRVLRPHLRLIVACVLVGLLAAWLLHLDDRQEFEASVRLVLNSPDPVNTSQASVLADTARGIASGPTVIRKALDEVGVARDPVRFGEHNVDVRPLGSSGILRLVVSDPNARVAVDMANAVAESVIAARSRLTEGQALVAVESLEDEIATLEKELTALDQEIDGLTPKAASSPPDADKLRDAESARDSVTRQLGQLQGELVTINGERALRPQAGIIDPARMAQPKPNSTVPDYLLGGLLGLIGGIALAAGRETLAPTVGGRAALARAFGAPILAELPAPPDRCVRADVAIAARYVELSALAGGIGRIEVMRLGPAVDVSRFVGLLDEELSSAIVHEVDPSARPGPASPHGPRPEPVIPVDRRHNQTKRDSRRRGLVVVVPDVVRLSAMEPARNLMTITGWPLLGVVVFRRVGRRLPLVRPRKPAPSLPVVGPPLADRTESSTKGAGA